jgi:hypothetical protein
MIFQIWNSKRYDENMKVKGREMVAFVRLCWCFRVQQRSSGLTFDWGSFHVILPTGLVWRHMILITFCNSSSCTTLFIPASHFNCRIHSNI